MNFYNEIDPKAAAWLRELIAAGLIPPGVVDERSITEIQPHELTEYTQCHFFAGIAGWSLALQLADVPNDVRLWTGSCPCQPYSLAGKGKGDADERNLWPAFFNLIRECKPERVFGEQVESAVGHGWLDGISADLESQGYACGAVVLGAHSVGSPHIRQRLYWMADRIDGRSQDGWAGGHGEDRGSDSQWTANPDDMPTAEKLRTARGLADSERKGLEGHARNGDYWNQPRRKLAEPSGHAAESGGAGVVANSPIDRIRSIAGICPSEDGTEEGGGNANRGSGDVGSCRADGRLEITVNNGTWRDAGATGGLGGESLDAGAKSLRQADREAGSSGADSRSASSSSHWSTAIWHPCRDGKARRVPDASKSIFQLVSDGIWDTLGRGWNYSRDQIKQTIISHAEKAKTSPGKILRTMLEITNEKAIREHTGGFDGVPEEEILLFELCQLARSQEFVIDIPASTLCAAREIVLREMRGKEEPARSPQEPELEGSFTGQSGDSLHGLSPTQRTQTREVEMLGVRGEWREAWNVPEALSAVQEVWRSIVDQDQNRKRIPDLKSTLIAASGFPLSGKVPGRVGILRGAGNAIVPQVAAEFIKAALD